MARETIFRPDVGGGRAIQLPMANAEAFGSGIGRAIDQAGSVVKAQERDDEWAAKAVQVESFETELSSRLTEMRASPAAGGAGHSEAALKAFDEGRDRLLGDVRDSRIRQRLSVELAQRRSAIAAREGQWETGKRIDSRFQNIREAGEIAVNRLASDPTPENLDLTLRGIHERYDGLDIGGADAKDAAARQEEQRAVEAYLRGLRDKGQAAEAIAAIDGGQFDELLTPEQRAQVRSEVDVVVRREQSQAAAVQRQAVAAERDALRTEMARIDVGGGDGGSYRELARRAEAVGMGPEAVRLTAKATAWDAAQGFRGATPAERQSQIAALEALPTRTPEQGATLDGLKQQAAVVDGMTAIERLTYATGQAVAPIDWADPASVTARRNLVDSAAETWGGAPEFLLPAEIDELRGVVERGGAAEKAAAAAAIVATGRHAGAILDRVASGDASFRAAAKLAAVGDGGVRYRTAMEGAELLKANRTLLDRPKDESGKLIGFTFDQVWSLLARGPLRGFPPEALADMRENTLNTYAVRASQGGFASFRANHVAGALGYSLGGERRGSDVVGGLARMRDQWVVVPNGMSQAQFVNRLARSTDTDWARASNGAPMTTGGRKASGAEVRAMTPVWVGGTRYKMATGPNSYATTEKGAPFVVDVARLPSR